MEDLISRQAAIDAVRNYLLECQIEDGDYHADGIMYELDRLPSAQPLSNIDLIELEHRFGIFVREIVEDMLSGEGKRWEKKI